MAVPFNLPDEQVEAGATAASGSSSVASTVPNSPSHPIPIPQPNGQQSQPQIPAIDNEALVQAFYEALCRCSQGKLFNKKCVIALYGEFFNRKNVMDKNRNDAS